MLGFATASFGVLQRADEQPGVDSATTGAALGDADPGDAFRQWREYLQDSERVAAATRIAARRVEEVSRQLGELQTQIVRLDAAARGMVARAGMEPDEFDFDHEPAVGGPEEPIEFLRAGASIDGQVERLGEQVADRGRQFDILRDLLRWRSLNEAIQPDGRPVAAGYMSSRFGSRIDPFTGKSTTHKGIDFAARKGTEVVAVAQGVVTWSGPRYGYGNMVEIDHGNGVSTRYAHNDENIVAVGEVVTRGQLIAKLGATGRATGPNLHFEVLRDGRAVNPLPYIE